MTTEVGHEFKVEHISDALIDHTPFKQPSTIATDGLKVKLEHYYNHMNDLPESIKLFKLRNAFAKVILDINHQLNLKSSTNSSTIMFKTVEVIVAWNHSFDFIMNLSWFIDQLEKINETTPSYKGKYVDEALLYIDEHLKNNDLTVNALSKRLGISTTHLNNLFKKEMQQTVAQYIRQQKIKAIIADMENNKKTLKEIREEFGFENASYFSQFFKKETNQAPLKYFNTVKTSK